MRDLEERCRRFDQMGLEANMEMQRVARNLKEENEALRGFVIRIGYGNMMSTILDGVGTNRGGQGDGSFQSAFAGDFGGMSNEKANEESRLYNNSNLMAQHTASQQHQNQNQNYNHQRAKTTSSAQTQPGNYQQTLPNQSWLGDTSSFNVDQEKRSSNSGENASPSSDTTSNSSQNGPLLSLNLNSNANQGSKEQTQPEFSNTQENGEQARLLSNQAVSPNTAITNLLGQMNSEVHHANNNHGNQGGISGSAMLGNYTQNSPRGMPSGANNYTPYPVQRNPANDALLNPNPIPFAFNLSNDPPQPTSSWWEQMGGSRFDPTQETNELDEKAQAVAAAQNNNGGAQSPFDLSAFLQGGITPGGGFSLGGFISDPSSGKDKQSAVASGSGGANGTDGQLDDTDHMRIFIQLLERKVAEREAQTVATLGFQPPSQDPSQRRDKGRLDSGDNQDKPKVTFTSALTPTGVYSRLAEHPAFLSTDARELEELVDALEPGAARSPSETKNRTDIKQEESDSDNKNLSSPSLQGQDSSSTSHHTRSSRDSHSSSPTSVEVDEGAIERLMGLLDQKRISKGTGNGNEQHLQRLSMAMT